MVNVLLNEMNSAKDYIAKIAEGYWPKKYTTMQFNPTEFVDQTFVITAPIIVENSEQIVSIDIIDLSKSHTFKPGNIIINWKKLIKMIPDIAITISAATGPGWVLPFVVLNIIRDLYDIASIDIKVDHATCILALWKSKGALNKFDETRGLCLINEVRVKLNLKTINNTEFLRLIEDLESINCLKMENSEIKLIEEVRIKYS